MDIDDWREAYLEFAEDNGLDTEHVDDDDIYQYMIDTNHLYLDDQRMNLDIEISQPIIEIAELGLWNGRFTGYKELHSCNIKDCLDMFQSCEYHEWYVDEDGDLRCEAVHHDGTNHVLYRAYRDDVTEEQIEEFLSKIYNGRVTDDDIDALTCSLGDEIAKIYGW